MPSVLVVDDEPISLRLCGNILKRGGYEITTAAGAEEAKRLLENNQFDLALLDVIMPVMNGIQLANHIREVSPETRIVLMSGYGPKEIAQVAGGENPYRIIWKPFKSESLLQMIENVLDGQSQSA
jgi:DNA-binding NtrC family response regulator